MIQRVPNFLIIGAPKCGTTAMYMVLRRHPDIFMSPVKEPYYFAMESHAPSFVGPTTNRYREAVTDWNVYLRLFEKATDQLAIGEASPIYLTDYLTTQTADNIRKRLPDVRLIAILRQPADRAYSHYCFRRQIGLEPLTDFRKACEQEENRVLANWDPMLRYRRNGLYFTNLQPYFARFPRDQIRIYLYEDWNEKPREVLSDIFRFLGIEDKSLPGVGERHKVTALPRSHTVREVTYYLKQLVNSHILPVRLQKFVKKRLRAVKGVKPPPMDPILRRELIESYREEITNLQMLLGRNLSRWLEV